MYGRDEKTAYFLPGNAAGISGARACYNEPNVNFNPSCRAPANLLHLSGLKPRASRRSRLLLSFSKKNDISIVGEIAEIIAQTDTMILTPREIASMYVLYLRFPTTSPIPVNVSVYIIFYDTCGTRYNIARNVAISLITCTDNFAISTY